MPLGETIGAILPRNSSLPVILLFAFVLGVGATFAEPAIAILRQAGAGVAANDTPLLFSLLNDFSSQLVSVVGIGVGFAVSLGVLRFFLGWSMKLLIIPVVSVLLGLTILAHQNDILFPILGLAWDCGAVTTGPVTVPLVLALGIGVCRVVGDADTSNAGFGIVTLASLFPILAVLGLGFYHYLADDYYGRPGYAGPAESVSNSRSATDFSEPTVAAVEFSAQEFQRFLATGTVDTEHRVRYELGERTLENGRIVLRDSTIILEKIPQQRPTLVGGAAWDPDQHLVARITESIFASARAITYISATDDPNTTTNRSSQGRDLRQPLDKS